MKLNKKKCLPRTPLRRSIWRLPTVRSRRSQKYVFLRILGMELYRKCICFVFSEIYVLYWTICIFRGNTSLLTTLFSSPSVTVFWQLINYTINSDLLSIFVFFLLSLYLYACVYVLSLSFFSTFLI